jgi:hypothetical protein
MMKKCHKAAVLWLFAVAILMLSCQAQEQPIDQSFIPPVFSVALAVNAEQETRGSLVVANRGDTVFPADEFGAVMNLWDQNADLRARIDAAVVQEIQPGESVDLASGTWRLDPGVYFLTWGSPKYGGVVTVFSVVTEDDWLHLGESQSFRTKPAYYSLRAESAGSVRGFTRYENGSLLFRGETQVPADGCLFTLLYDQDGMLDGFPVGKCAEIEDDHWQFEIQPDPQDSGSVLDAGSNYGVILFSNDLTLAPSEPFVIEISPPIQE